MADKKNIDIDKIPDLPDRLEKHVQAFLDRKAKFFTGLNMPVEDAVTAIGREIHDLTLDLLLHKHDENGNAYIPGKTLSGKEPKKAEGK